VYDVADAVDVDDDEVLAVGVEDALELADHAVPLSRSAEEDSRRRVNGRRPRARGPYGGGRG
jgi:hypothetical protein